MKKLLTRFFSVLILALLASCYGNEDEDSDYDYGEHDISEIYGYTYQGTVNASSGNKLTPEITLYNSTRLDWNMSSTGMANNQFYYHAEPYSKDGKTYSNVYETYWYAEEAVMNADTNRTKYSMRVFLAINTLKSITTMVQDAGNTGAGSSMAGTPIDMDRNSGTKNTTPSEIKKTEEEEKIEDITITVEGDSAEWLGDSSTYTGTFVYLVGDNGNIGKGKGSSGDGVTPEVSVTKTDGNTVTVRTPKMVYEAASMTVESYDVAEVSVTKNGDVYYLSKGEFTSNDGTYEIKGTSLTGKLENGVLTLRIVFQPGSMPFPITEIFTSN